MTWKNESLRHKLSAMGVKSSRHHSPVYVGGRESIRFSEEKIPYPSGKRYSTDLANCFHTSLRPDVAYSFAIEHSGRGYILHLDLSNTPDYKIFRQEDWTPFMAFIFYTEYKIPFNMLVKERPDMREYLESLGYELGDQITIEDLEEGLFDIFAYPSVDVNDIVKREYMEGEYYDKPKYRIPHEDEIAIFDKELVEDAWERKFEVPIKKLAEEDIKYHKKRMKKLREM